MSVPIPTTVAVQIRTNLKPLKPYVFKAFPDYDVIQVDLCQTWKSLFLEYKIPVQDTHIVNSGQGKVVSDINTMIGDHINKCRSGRTGTGSGKRKCAHSTYIIAIGLDKFGKVYGKDTPVRYKLSKEPQLARKMARSIPHSESRHVHVPPLITWETPGFNGEFQYNSNGQGRQRDVTKVLLERYLEFSNRNFDGHGQDQEQDGQEEETDLEIGDQLLSDDLDESASQCSQFTLFSQDGENPDQLDYDRSINVKAAINEYMTKSLSQTVLLRMKKEYDEIRQNKKNTLWLKIASYIPTVGLLITQVFDDKNFQPNKRN